MKAKKILIVTRHFYPANTPRAFRATELAKEFARQGHAVTVLTTRIASLHAPLEAAYGFTVQDLGQPRWPVPVVRGKGLRRLWTRALVRFSELLLEYPAIEYAGMIRRSLQCMQGFDLLISNAAPYPVHWGVAAARSSRHRVASCWIADCGDPYMGQENDSFAKPFYFRFVEKWFCRKADFLTVPTTAAVRGYYPEFHSKIRVIPQGFCFEDVALQPCTLSPGRAVFAYAGIFIPGKRDPRALLTYLCNLSLDFEFRIYTSTPELVQPFVERSGGRIRLMPVLPRLQLLSELSGLHFVVNFENVGTRQTPSKLIDYAIIRKPILGIASGNLNETLVAAFLAGDYSGQTIVPDPDQYRIERVCNQFMQLAFPDAYAANKPYTLQAVAAP